MQRLGAPAAVEATLAADYNRACLWYGRWTDRRAAEKKLVTVPKPARNAPTKAEVPRYQTLAEILGEAPPATKVDPLAPVVRGTGETPAEKQAMALLKDPKAYGDFMADLIG